MPKQWKAYYVVTHRLRLPDVEASTEDEAKLLARASPQFKEQVRATQAEDANVANDEISNWYVEVEDPEYGAEQ